MALIKTTKSWKRHLPQKPQKVQRGYYSRQKNIQQKTILRIIFIILFVLVAQSIFQIKFLKIKNIEINNNNDLAVEEIQGFILDKLAVSKFLFFEKNNYFLVPIDDLDVSLVSEYNLEEVILSKKWPNTLEVTVKEKSSHFIWQKDELTYLLDAKGLLNRQISNTAHKYLVLDDKRDGRPIGDQIFNNEEIGIINNIYLNWMDLIASKVKLEKITIYNDWTIELNTQTGFYVKIDKDQDIHEQLNNLKSVLDENITGVDIDYIDIRFGDKVYFK